MAADVLRSPSHAGGEQHYATCLENEDGFEVELAAPPMPDQASECAVR
jgi:hypothetical protein